MTDFAHVFNNLVPKLRCPECRSGSLESQCSPGAVVICVNCRANYEFVDEIIDLTPDLPESLVKEDSVHRERSKVWESQIGDPVSWALGLPKTYRGMFSRRQDRWIQVTESLLRQSISLLNLEEGPEVLDLGAGATWSTRHILKAGAGFAVSLDLNTYPLRGLSTAHIYFKSDNIRYGLVRGVMEELPFLDNTFDRVVSFASIHHSEDLPRLFSETQRVLRPGGFALFQDSVNGFLYQYFARRHAQQMNKSGLNDHALTLPLLKKAARKGGFPDVITPPPDYWAERLRLPQNLPGRNRITSLFLKMYNRLKGSALILIAKKPKA